MEDRLFEEFDEVSSEQWKQKIESDLHKVNYNKNLVCHTLEGIDIKTFYHKDYINSSPSIAHPKSWSYGEKIEIYNNYNGSVSIKKAISRGANSLYLELYSEEINIEHLLEEYPVNICFYFVCKKISETCIKNLQNYTLTSNKNIVILVDPIEAYVNSGNWLNNQESDFKTLLKNKTSGFENFLSVNLNIYQNAGANIVQQLAYALSHCNEYLHYLKENSIDLLKLSIPVFQVAVGSNYFFEIAKIRALRLLWNTLADTYNLSKSCHIVATPSKRNKTIIEPETNSIRTSMECMSAILGGADMIYNLPHNGIYGNVDEESNKMALNQLLILYYECNMNQKISVVEGSYYITSLTKELAEKALKLFKTIEQKGGFLAQLEKGTIQKEIKESDNKEQQLFDNRKLTLVGVNNYLNTEVSIYKKPITLKKKDSKTLITPLFYRRLAEKIELKIFDNG